MLRLDAICVGGESGARCSTLYIVLVSNPCRSRGDVLV